MNNRLIERLLMIGFGEEARGWNAADMLFGHLLTNTTMIFAAVCTDPAWPAENSALYTIKTNPEK
jgi:hypothetical protein